MLKLNSIYLLIFLGLSVLSFSQSLKFENYTTKDGLISDEVYKIYQDKKGYIWIFTNYGAMKYNGKEFIPVLKNLPFNQSFIYSYYESEKGQKWIANSNAKIYEINNDTVVMILGIDKLSKKLKHDGSEISELLVDKNKNIYINTKRDSYKLIKRNNYQPIEIAKQYDGDSISTYIFEIGNELFSATSSKFKSQGVNPKKKDITIKFINENNFKKTFSLKVEGSNLFVPSFFKRIKNEIYFSFDGNIFKIKNGITLKKIAINSVILNYVKDRNNHLWVGTLNNGLYELDENDSIINHYLKNKTINHVLIDSNEGLWATTSESGIFYCKNLNETHFENSSAFKNEIRFLKKIETKLFLADLLGNIFIIENDKPIIVKHNATKNLDVLDIIKYKTGYIICYRYHFDFLEITKNATSDILPLIQPAYFPTKLFNLDTDSILCLSNTNILILNDGIKSLSENKKNIILNLPHKLYDFAKRNNDRLFATDDGVYILANNRLVQPNYLQTTKNSKVIKIIKDNTNNFWFCTKGSGIFKLTPKNSLINYTKIDNLPSNIINNISFESDNSILLSTNNGLFYTKYSDLGLQNWTKIYDEQVKNSIEFNDKIYTISRNGLVTINKDLKNKNNPIYFNLASIIVNGTNNITGKIKKIKYHENNIEFNYDIISLSENITSISYTLTGTIKKSGTVNNKQIILQNLSPGIYTLIASISSENKILNYLTTQFEIIPAFWQTNWFYGLISIICFLLFFLISWLFIRYFKNKENKKNENNRLITEYKLIALRAQINPHFMSNCLTAIQNLISNNKPDLANQYLAKFSFLVRQVLNFSSKSLVSLKDELEITELNLELEQLRFDNKFVFQIEYDDSIDLGNILVPPLIIQPIIENAIWHGLLPLNKIVSGKLWIKIRLNNNTITIIIEDNGIGRKNEIEVLNNQKESSGIKITKQRILNLNNLHNITNGDFYYEDLKDELNNPIGTRVYMILPLLMINDYE